MNNKKWVFVTADVAQRPFPVSCKTLSCFSETREQTASPVAQACTEEGFTPAMETRTRTGGSKVSAVQEDPVLKSLNTPNLASGRRI